MAEAAATVTVEQAAANLLAEVERLSDARLQLIACADALETAMFRAELPFTYYEAVVSNLQDYRTVTFGIDGDTFTDQERLLDNARDLMALVRFALQQQDSRPDAGGHGKPTRHEGR